jgi:hypothetical protein
MPVFKLTMGHQEIELEYDDTPAVPDEWIEMLNQLHPLTACVVWEILTANLSPATISLAQNSPDYDRYEAIRIVAGGNPETLLEVASLARPELEEIFVDLIPNDPRRIIH